MKNYTQYGAKVFYINGQLFHTFNNDSDASEFCDYNVPTKLLPCVFYTAIIITDRDARILPFNLGYQLQNKEGVPVENFDSINDAMGHACNVWPGLKQYRQ